MTSKYLQEFTNVYEYISKLFYSNDPKYSLIIILLTMLLIYYVLGKVFAFIGFIVCMYYIYQYWYNRDNINNKIKKLFIAYENIIN